ncbi:hypothetical protein Vretimale_200, partial [Volvox reticuliferus]
AVNALTVGEKWSDSGGGGGDGGGGRSGIVRPLRRGLLRQLASGVPPERSVQCTAAVQDGTAATTAEGELFADLIEACLRLDPTRRPTAEQALQMPYFDSYRIAVLDTAVVPNNRVGGETQAAGQAGGGPNVVTIENGEPCVVSGGGRSSSSTSENGREAAAPPTPLATTATAAATAAATAEIHATAIGNPPLVKPSYIPIDVVDPDGDLGKPSPAPAPAPPMVVYDTNDTRQPTSQQLATSSSSVSLNLPVITASAESMEALTSRQPTATINRSASPASASASASASSTPRFRIRTANEEQTPESAPLPVVDFPTDMSPASTGGAIAVAPPIASETDPRVIAAAGKLALTFSTRAQHPVLLRTSLGDSSSRGLKIDAGAHIRTSTSTRTSSPLRTSRGGGAATRSPGTDLRPQRPPWSHLSRSGRGGESALDLPLVLLQGDRSVVARYNLSQLHPTPRSSQCARRHGPMGRSMPLLLPNHGIAVQNDSDIAEENELMPPGICEDQYDTAIATARWSGPGRYAQTSTSQSFNPDGVLDGATAPVACQAASGGRDVGWRLEGEAKRGFSGPLVTVNVNGAIADQALPYLHYNRRSYDMVTPRGTSPPHGSRHLVLHPSAVQAAAFGGGGGKISSAGRRNSESQLVIVPRDPWVNGAAAGGGGGGGPGAGAGSLGRRGHTPTGTPRPDAAIGDGSEAGRPAAAMEAEPEAIGGPYDSGTMGTLGRARPHSMRWAGSVRVGGVVGCVGGGGGGTYGSSGASDGPLPRLINVLQRELVAQHQCSSHTIGGGGGGGGIRSSPSETDLLQTLSEVCESSCSEICLPVIMSVTQPDAAAAAAVAASVSYSQLPSESHSQRHLAPPSANGTSAATSEANGGGANVPSMPAALTMKDLARRAK